ncbi:phage integrase family protein [Maricaulis maris MCS10]|uniref:Phage integrase family protein n=2 Tax=Maricaulis maris TaxID=74318 RepID=Q0APJ0_MARMM|nr:phage integrase family protein [Maricaulis maris MCS10]
MMEAVPSLLEKLLKRRYRRMNYVYARSDSGIFELRYPIPKDLRAFYPKPNGKGARAQIIRSLGTKDAAEANRLASTLIVEAETQFSALRDQESASDFQKFLRDLFEQEIADDLAVRSGPADKKSASYGAAFLDPMLRALESDDIAEQEAAVSWVIDAYFEQSNGGVCSIPGDCPLRARLCRLAAEVYADLYRVKNARERGLGAEPQPKSAVLQEPPVSSSSNTALSPNGSVTVSEYFDIYERQRQGAGAPLAEATLRRQRVAWGEFCSTVGETTPLVSIAKSDVWQHHDMLNRYPQRAGSTNALRSLSFVERVEWADKNPGNFANLDQDTIGDRLRMINTVFNHAVKRGDLANNPAAGVTASKKGGEPARVAYTPEELQAIFRMPGFYDVRLAIATETSEFWVPLVCLFSGARSSELYVPMVDVHESADIPHLRLVPVEERTLKNPPSARNIPIHSELIRLGFLDYCARMRARREEFLFPEWTFRPGEKPSSGAERRRFNGALKRLLRYRGGARMDTHTFRHTFETVVSTLSDVPERVLLRFLGRKIPGSAGIYVKEIPLESLKDAVDKLSYRDLELSHLYP